MQAKNANKRRTLLNDKKDNIGEKERGQEAYSDSWVHEK